MIREKKINVALLCGGRSAEREVSLAGAAEVERAFDTERFNVIKYDALTDLPRLVSERETVDVVFILLHGRYGEDGTVQGMLDLLDLPYQGADVTGSALAMNKHLSKLVYRDAGIPTPDWIIVGREGLEDHRKLSDETGFPLMVKPCNQGSSVGMSVIREASELNTSLEAALEWDDAVILEKFVDGREITVGVIEDLESGNLIALPAVEICPGERHAFFDYDAKYVKGETREICPADIPEELAEKAADYAVSAHRALGLRDYSRTDMMISHNGEIFVIETNTIPGMTATSLLPQAAARWGLTFADLLERLVMLALRRAR